MNTKKLFIGGIVGGIINFFLGYLFYGKLLMNYFAEHHGPTQGFMRADPVAMPFLIYLILGNLLIGFLLAYIFLKARINSFGGGLVTGGVIGLLYTAAYDCLQYATTTLMSKHGCLADIIASAIMTAISGAVIALVIGKGNQ